MFARRLALAIAVLAGLIGSQGPEFAQQYRQRMGRALEELNRIVSEFDAEVRGQNMTRAEGLKTARWRTSAARTWPGQLSALSVSASGFRP
jgi:hypothetical protein